MLHSCWIRISLFTRVSPLSHLYKCAKMCFLWQQLRIDIESLLSSPSSKFIERIPCWARYRPPTISSQKLVRSYLVANFILRLSRYSYTLTVPFELSPRLNRNRGKRVRGLLFSCHVLPLYLDVPAQHEAQATAISCAFIDPWPVQSFYSWFSLFAFIGTTCWLFLDSPSSLMEMI